MDFDFKIKSEVFRTVQVMVELLIEPIRNLAKDLNLPQTIKEAEIPEEEFLSKRNLLLEAAFDDQCTGLIRVTVSRKSSRCS